MSGVPQPYVLGTPYSVENPLDYDDAREAAHKLAEQRREAREWLERSHAALAREERAYRELVAKTWAEVKAEGEMTAGQAKAEVDGRCAGQRQERDVAAAIVEAAKERLKEIDATRASFHQLLAWSAKVAPNGDQHQVAA